MNLDVGERKKMNNERHYYRYIGRTYRSSIATKFFPAGGYIFKCLTEQQVIDRSINYGEVWKKVVGDTI